MIRTLSSIAIAAIVAVSSGSAIRAESVSLKAALSAQEEVPPTASKGLGSIDATYDTASKKLSWKGTYSSLSGPATAAHFHGPAEKGANAGVLIPAPASTSPFEGSATLTDAQAAALMDGKGYFNIHTSANPNGEIRGQISKSK